MRAHDLKAVAHTHGSPYLLLRVCLRSYLRREPGRWPGVSNFCGKPTPYPSSGPHSPPRWRTRGRRCDLPLPLQEKSNFWSLSGQPIAPDPGNQPRRLLPDRAAPAPLTSKHTNRDVLAEPSNNTKKPRLGQTYSAGLETILKCSCLKSGAFAPTTGSAACTIKKGGVSASCPHPSGY